ncbi:MAG: heme-binding protein [SAR202 cluster bacterium]|nr:heme-binding protein [SAR202 cluster bacterium]
MRWTLRVVAILMVVAGLAVVAMAATSAASSSKCKDLPSEAQLKAHLQAAPAAGGSAGGLFEGERMWGAVVNRAGELCAFTTSTDDPTQVWPGSEAISKAKAYTANAFSLDDLALSTAMLYTFVQPGHSLFGLNNSNPFNPDFLGKSMNEGQNKVAGDVITFGGGTALYKNGKIIGGLGISGDTACADHEISKRVRNLAGLNPPGGPLADDIVYSPPEPPSVFAHPKCVNTWKNGVFIGNETLATYP